MEKSQYQDIYGKDTNFYLDYREARKEYVSCAARFLGHPNADNFAALNQAMLDYQHLRMNAETPMGEIAYAEYRMD